MMLPLPSVCVAAFNSFVILKFPSFSSASDMSFAASSQFFPLQNPQKYSTSHSWHSVPADLELFPISIAISNLNCAGVADDMISPVFG